jgi:fructose-bisphosphate aldolase class II
MEGIMLGAQRYAAATGNVTCVVGIGFTATYPDHPQLEGLALERKSAAGPIKATAATWLHWLDGYADRLGLLDEVEVIPFMDHGWAPHEVDLELMHEAWFQAAVGIIMFDASAFDFDENIRLTAEFARQVKHQVVVEACPDKVYEHSALLAKRLSEADLLSRPEAVERFVAQTGVDLIVPNLGTEHRSASHTPLRYRRDLAQEIARRVGPIQALHGTSSLGGRLATVGQDGICKINYYTAMARAATQSLRQAWEASPDSVPLPIAQACGSFLHRTRREAVAENVYELLRQLHGSSVSAQR